MLTIAADHNIMDEGHDRLDQDVFLKAWNERELLQKAQGELARLRQIVKRIAEDEQGDNDSDDDDDM